MVVGTLAGLCAASIFPLMFFMYGQVAGTLVDFDKIKVFDNLFNNTHHEGMVLLRNGKEIFIFILSHIFIL
jgi:hypothetical protein